jgi:hypothetical protein
MADTVGPQLNAVEGNARLWSHNRQPVTARSIIAPEAAAT